MYKFIVIAFSVFITLFSNFAYPKGGFSGGGRGGFSSGSRSFSSPSRSPSPSYTTSSAPRPMTNSAPRTTTTTTVTRNTHVSPGVSYGGMGMGYGYSNGMLTGLIIGNMMHPHNTVVYTGGGVHNNNALLYPDGRVVAQNGQQVGTYSNGTFTPIENGPIVAQPVPADANVKSETSVLTYFTYFVLVAIAIVLFVVFLGIIL